VPEYGVSERKWFSLDEINRILNVPVSSRLELVRDIIAFSFFTGISYSYIAGLKQSNFERQEDGSLRIILERQKTGTASYVPLLPVPLQIIEKYRDSPYSGWRGRVFRTPSLCHINEHLKEFAKQAGITRNISFHACRHSFATLCLTEGLPIETLSQVMGHKNITSAENWAICTTFGA
jgi:integrase